MRINNNCKILGEVEGKDYITGKSGATKESIRECIINDLHNEASNVVGKGKRAMVTITIEISECESSVGFRIQTIDCNRIPKVATNSTPISYRISTQVFDCGDK